MSEYDDLLKELLVERHRRVPPPMEPLPDPIDPVQARRNARILDHEVAEFDRRSA